MGACEGDCDGDDDCLDDLVCFQRKGLEQVPSCTGTGVVGTDYCHVPPTNTITGPPTDAPDTTTPPPPFLILQDVGNNGNPHGAFPLGECQGDCDQDGDCEGTLKCFQRQGHQPVPGCAGLGSPGTDYCYSHYTGYGTLSTTANNRVPPDAFPLQVCQGDCDVDRDCGEGLFCYQRGLDSTYVPGCIGPVHGHSDYCINIIKPSGPMNPSPSSPGVTYRPGEATVLMEGLLLSTGLQARKIAIVGQTVKFDNGGESKEVFHSAPDGAGIFVDPSGSGDYVYVSNSESPIDGGVGAIRFHSTGQVIGYHRLRFVDPKTGMATKTTRNCGGGKTYWGTWLTCEEWNEGQVWEVDPWGKIPGRMTQMGGRGRAYESAAYDNRDPNNPKFFITIDEPNGPLVRYSPASSVAGAAVSSGDYSKLLHSNGGTLEYFKVTSISEKTDGTASGKYVWTNKIEEGNASAAQYHINGEGIDVRDGKLYYTTKIQKYLFIVNLDDGTFVRSSTVSGAFDAQPDQVTRVLNFATGATDGILYFCEDGADNAGVHGRDAQGRFFTILQDASRAMVGETTGLAFSPGGKFMYVSFQKPGIIFEIRRTDGLPFDGATLDIKYHSNEDPTNSNSFRMLWNDNAKVCELNAEMCL